MIAHAASAGVGIWLMVAPAVLGYGGHAATADRIVGPLVASFAIIAMAGVTRSVRWVNVVLAVWMLAVPWLLGYERNAAVNAIASGVLLLSLSLVRGRIRHPYGGGWAALRR